MKVSHKGRWFIASQEAIVLTAYPDGPHLSIGLGHNDPSLKPGDTVTLEQALDLFAKDLTPREEIVAKMFAGPLTQGQADGFVSAYYNKGSLLRPVADLWNGDKRDEAMAAFLQINRNAAGQFRPGLFRRRLCEMAIILHDDYGDLGNVKVWRGDPNAGPPDLMPFPPDS